MNKKKVKLRLRKPFVIALPVILIVIILSVVLINKDNLFTKEKEVENTSLASFNKIESDYSLGDSEYILALNKLIETRQKDNTIIAYAGKYNLNIDKTLEIAHKLTKDYEDEYFLKTNAIVTEKYKAKVGSFKSFEAGAVYFIKDIFTYPQKYGVTIEEMRLSDAINNEKNRHDGHIWMSNGLTFEQYLGKICDLYDVDKEFALAVVYEESGKMTSGLFNISNNIGGQRGYDGWMKFTSLESGTIFFVLNLRTIVAKAGGDTNTYEGILKISGIYVRGNIDKPSEDWTRKVMLFKDSISKKDLFTIKK